MNFFNPAIFMPKAGVFVLTHSLVLVAASSQYLQRTMGAPTSTNKATMAFWYKLASAGSAVMTFYDGGSWNGVGTNSTQAPSLSCGTQVLDDNIYDGSASISDLTSAGGQPIDTTTWHHVCYAYDTTQATASNRGHLYVDGTEVAYGGSNVYPALNATLHWITSGRTAQISRVWGRDGSAFTPGQYVDGKLADFFLIDGQQLTPSSFISGTGAGTCHPIAYGGTFGSQGFHLSFSASDTTDSSGNGNNWTQFNTPTFSTDVPV
jgi:Concanavalin A-like lectin/glucanases superfamily